MKNSKKLLSLIFAVILCCMVVFSIADTEEVRYDTNFDQEAMIAHMEHLTANGPRSIYDTAENQLALDYIVSLLEGWGFTEGDRTDVPAYLIQEFVTDDDDYQAFYLKNIIVHIPANSPAPTGEALMIMGHTDSVPMGAGASDDGVAVATMLEAIRHYTQNMAQGYTVSNDLVFSFVNGEEFGLYGSEAFMEEFTGFDRVVERIRFGANLESRGTSGTLIMFETAANNYNTVKLFSEINENVFTSSVATMIYDMMPNGTDFSNFKDVYQGLNFANLGGGENYHTQNDDMEHLGMTYLSQNAMIVDAILDKLANYDLDRLHDAEGSAVFFSYLNAATVVYDHAAAYAIGAVLLAMMLANVWLNRKKHLLLKTVKGVGAIAMGLALTAAVTHACYYLFQYIAVLAGVLDRHAVGTITFSNVPVVVGIGLGALAVSVLTTILCTRWFRIRGRDMARAFAYLHGVLGVALTVVLPDASYLFVFSGLLFMGHELIVTIRPDAADAHGELLAAALYMPVIMPILVLATSALGLTMAYVFGMIFSLGIFAVGIALADRKANPVSPVRTAAVLFAAAMALALCVSISRPNANVNLQGKQNNIKLPYDDALVYVVDQTGSAEYRVYDLNAVGYLKDHAPEMEYRGEYYAGAGPRVDVEYQILSQAAGNTLTIREFSADNLIWLTFTNIQAESFTISDGITSITYPFEGRESYGMTIHSDCTVTVNGGSADVAYREVLRDYEKLIPENIGENPQRLHFNLWLTVDSHLK